MPTCVGVGASGFAEITHTTRGTVEVRLTDIGIRTPRSGPNSIINDSMRAFW